MNQDKPEVSFVIPLYNERESLLELKEKISRTMAVASRSFEIIFVDDGSTDGSGELIERMHREDPRVRLVQFRKNFGKSAALDAGFRVASGRYVVTMDADLQDDPEEVPALLKKLEEGYDLVSGWKKRRRDPLSRRLASKIYNYFTYVFSGIRLHDFNCGLKAYRREVVKNIRVYGELHRYIPVVAHKLGFRVTELPVRHHPRKYGRSKFGAARFFRGAFDLMTVTFLTRYSKRPLHLFGFIGIVCFVAGSAVSAVLAYQRIFLQKYLSNRPLLFLGILLIIIGIQFFSIGLLGEMITAGNQHADVYLVRKTIGFGDGKVPFGGGDE